MDIESQILSFGREIFAGLEKHKRGLLDLQNFTEKLMEYGMRDEDLKVSLFRFVDVLPTLGSSAAVIQHVQEYFEPIRDKIPAFIKPGLSISPQSITSAVVAKAIRKQVEYVAERFIIGETPQTALKALRKIRKNSAAFTVDLVGEATVGEAEAEHYIKRYLDLLDTMAAAVPGWPEAAPIIANHLGEQTILNISVKPTAICSRLKPVATDFSVAELTKQLEPIYAKAKACNAFVYVDMEDCSMTSITLAAFRRLMESEEFRAFPHTGIVLQAYLRRTEADLDELIAWAKQRKTPIAVRLVKGAYWDSETVLAKQHGWPIPVWQQKSNSDACYERLTLKLLKHHELIFPAFGSHNIRSLTHACVAAQSMQIPRTAFELQMLHGMADPVKAAFAEKGFLVREYAPVGELVPGMGYLVRRLLENTSNEGFLRASFHEKRNVEALLSAPRFNANDLGTDHLQQDLRKTFSNAAFRDYTEAHNRRAAEQAVSSLAAELRKNPADIAPIIGGKKSAPAEALTSAAPEDPSFILGNVRLADSALAEQAVQRLAEFFPEWRDTPQTVRSEILFRAAELMEQRREELTALIRLEAGKPLTEADSDVAEAIDFCNYYALEALRLSRPQRMGAYPGEINTYFYEPRGVSLIISPWNFPLAIPCGMLTAALVTGNCAVFKPAEQTSIIALRLFEILLEAGLPPQAAAFLPGMGEEVGAYLNTHPLVSTICFTGSKTVGLTLIEKGSAASGFGEQARRVIAEMGGKNAIIVDDDADLDEAVKGVVHSAFGFQGQKCSACSRAIVLEGCYDRFLSRLTDAVRSLLVGPAVRPEFSVGPVIDREAHARISQTIAEAKRSCKLVAEAPIPPESNGYYVAPCAFADIPRSHPLLTSEIFGPVLAVERAESFDEALKMALASEYGLTGAVFSRSPKNIERAMREFRVGNLYINRGSTGALVFRQPFGGAKMSGVGSKAGGPDYLLQFLVPRSICENTLRRGFAPDDAAGV